MKYSSTNIMPQSSIAEAQQQFLTKVYAWMVGGLLLTGLTAWYVYTTELFIQIIQTGFLFPALIIGELGLVFFLSARIDRISTSTASGLYLFYSFLNGLTLSLIFAAYTAESIQSVFFIAAAMFAALSAYGYFTKKNLSGVGSFMFMGLIGIIIAIFVNIFIQSSALNFIISFIGVIIFAGLTAYDTQRLKDMYEVQAQGDSAAAKAAIIGALMLYLDFINLFLFLLRIFGQRR